MRLTKNKQLSVHFMYRYVERVRPKIFNEFLAVNPYHKTEIELMDYLYVEHKYIFLEIEDFVNQSYVPMQKNKYDKRNFERNYLLYNDKWIVSRSRTNGNYITIFEYVPSKFSKIKYNIDELERQLKHLIKRAQFKQVNVIVRQLNIMYNNPKP